MPANPVLLVVDYPGRRPEAHLSDMQLERCGFDCVYAPTPPLPTALTLSAYAGQLCARLQLDRPVAVVTYCGAAPLAVAMAGLLAGPAGGALPIAFLDPAPTRPDDLVNEYTKAVRQVEGRAPDAKWPPPLDLKELLTSPETLVLRIEEDLRLRARLALVAHGFTGADADGPAATVVGLYVEWLTFLVAAHYGEQPAPVGQLLQVISRNQSADTSWLGDAGIQTVRIPCDRPELARRAESRAAVLDFLHRFAFPASAVSGHEEIGHAG